MDVFDDLRTTPMDGDKIFTQSKMGTSLKFLFGPNQLTFTMSDYSGERQFSVSYENIGVTSSTVLTSNNRMFSKRLLAFPIVGFFLSVAADQYSNQMANWLAVVSAALLGVIYIGQLMNVFKIKYTMFPMVPAPPGAGGHPIRVIMDRQPEAIIAELGERWRRSVKLRYGSIDLNNDPAKEIARFSWMKDHGIIDETEHRIAMETLQNRNPVDQSSSPRRAFN